MASGAIGIVSVFIIALLAYNVVSDGSVTTGFKDFAFSPDAAWSDDPIVLFVLGGSDISDCRCVPPLHCRAVDE